MGKALYTVKFREEVYNEYSCTVEADTEKEAEEKALELIRSNQSEYWDDGYVHDSYCRKVTKI